MKSLAPIKKVTMANAWGRDQTTWRESFTVEDSDVGQTFAHYLGHNHKDYRMTRADVGRTLEVITAPAYRCWSFTN